MTEEQKERLITVSDYAKDEKVSRQTIYYRIRKGLMKAHYVAGNIYVDPQDVEPEKTDEYERDKDF